MVYLIFICLAAPMALMLPLVQPQSRWTVGFMLVGAFVAVCASEINGMMKLAFSLSYLDVSFKLAPVTEECLKALPVLLYAIFGSDDRKQVLSLSMATGIGFAMMENAYLLICNLPSVSLGWALIRGISTSLSHGICTLLIGCGIVYVRKHKKLFYSGTFALLTAAITLHATYNLLISSVYDTLGMLLPILLYLAAQGILLYSRHGHSTPDAV